ncbi:DUF2254 family protein [Streptomyces sp. NPDC021056]|uniref:DUF2254 family protein n=1 Tax=Streptomyces sp. NPDC021056 TaxID=3155012 RepID=UPI0033C5CDED
MVTAGALLGRLLPRWERHRPADGLSFDASTARATLAAVAGGMITLVGFVVTAIALVVQTVTGVSNPQAVRRLRALLDRLAARPDRQGLGGAAAGETLDD